MGRRRTRGSILRIQEGLPDEPNKPAEELKAASDEARSLLNELETTNSSPRTRCRTLEVSPQEQEVAPPLSHPATPPADRWLLRRPPPLRRDDRADAVGPPDMLMDPLRVVVGVAQQRPDPSATDCVPDGRLELLQVRGGAAAGDGGQGRRPAPGGSGSR